MRKGVHKVRSKLVDGTIRTYYYAWRGGPKLIGEPGSAAFETSYRAAKAMNAGPAEGTLQSITNQYRGSTAFGSLSDSSKRNYERYLRMIDDEFGSMSLKMLDALGARGTFMEWRDSLADRPRTADFAWMVLSRMLSFGVDRGLIRHNPCVRGGRIYKVDRREALWSEDDLARIKVAATPAEVWNVVLFALETGQRQGDCLKAQWSDIVGGKLSVRQDKTGARLMIPISPKLGALFVSLPRGEGSIITHSKGETWTPNSFRTSFQRSFAASGIARDLHFHDLRGTAITRLALAGCTVLEIAAVTGHSPANVSAILSRHYLGGQVELAEQAMWKLAKSG